MEYEDQYISENLGIVPRKEMAKHLNRTLGSINARIHNLGLTKKKELWTEDELNFIRENNHLSIEELTKHLNRSHHATFLAYRKLGFKKRPKLTVEYPEIYVSWTSMRKRCYRTKNHNYADYGGRGIKVCDEWKDDSTAFILWALENGWAPGLTLDRIDVNGDYSPENCKWSTIIEQCNNKRNNTTLTAFGETKSLADWSRDERCQAKYFTIVRRNKEGKMTPEEIITTKEAWSWAK